MDALAKRDYTSRSDIIRQSLLDKVRSKPEHDEWDDPVSENWRTVIDFREHGYPDGISSDKFMAILKKLDGQNK